MLQSMGSQRVRHNRVNEQLQMVSPRVMYRGGSWTIKKAEPEELMLSNCAVGEDSREPLRQHRDPTSPS